MEKKAQERLIVWGVVAVIVLVLLFSAVYTIPAGYRGVLLTFGKPSMEAKTEGLHFKAPFIQKIIKMDARTQKYGVEKVGAASKDLQDVFTDVTLNYYINQETVPVIYKTIGINYQDKIITPAILEVIKASTAQYTAEELITKRPEVKEKIDNTLKNRLKEFNIEVQAVSITDFKFSDVFSASIENKVVSTQLKLKSEIDLERIKVEAEQKITQAQAEAEALRLQKQQITPELLQLRQIEVQSKALDVQKEAIAKWNGVMPQITGGVTPFVSIGNLQTTTPQ